MEKTSELVALEESLRREQKERLEERTKLEREKRKARIGRITNQILSAFDFKR